MIDIQARLTAFAMLGATWVMWLLILLSIIGVAIIFERIWSLRPVSVTPPPLRSAVHRS